MSREMTGNDTTAASPLVIVVDDDGSFLRSVARLLRVAGYAVQTFQSARQLLATSPAPRPQCLLMDVHMPEMTGFELSDRLVAAGWSAPALFMTAFDTPQTRELAKKAGRLGLLLKPFSQDELLEAIRRAAHRPPEDPAAGGPATQR
jgi:FixJ family two-component response regulator